MRPTPAASPKPIVVVVDDDPAVRNSLKFSLELEGFSVRLFADAAALLQTQEPGHSDCLLLDYWLPRMNGLDLLAELRNRGVKAPAILMTSHPSAALKKRVANQGALLVEKPLLGNALSERIREALNGASN